MDVCSGQGSRSVGDAVESINRGTGFRRAALLSGSGESLNLTAALDALKKTRGNDLVNVREKDTSVRLWIDSSNTVE